MGLDRRKAGLCVTRASLFMAATMVIAVSFAGGVGGQRQSALVWHKTGNPSPQVDEMLGVAADASGVYFVGYDEVDGNRHWRMQKREHGDGSISWEHIVNPSTEYYEAAMDVAVAEGALYVAGYDQEGGGGNSGIQLRVEKRDAQTGNLVWVQRYGATTRHTRAYSVDIDRSGAYFVGPDGPGPRGSFQWLVQKRDLTRGELIWSAAEDPSEGIDEPLRARVDGSGLYIVGWDASPGDWQWRIEKRSLVNGATLWTHVLNPGELNDEAKDIVLDGSGLYVVGSDSAFHDLRWRIEKRDLETGEVIWSQASNPGGGDDVAFGVAVDPSGLYILGTDSSPGGKDVQWRYEKRSLVDGELLWSEVSNPSVTTDRPFDVTVWNGLIYGVGASGAEAETDWIWRIERRGGSVPKFR